MNGVGVDMDSRSSPALHAPFATGNLPRVRAEGIVEVHKLSPPRGETTSAPRSEYGEKKSTRATRRNRGAGNRTSCRVCIDMSCFRAGGVHVLQTHAIRIPTT